MLPSLLCVRLILLTDNIWSVGYLLTEGFTPPGGARTLKLKASIVRILLGSKDSEISSLLRSSKKTVAYGISVLCNVAEYKRSIGVKLEITRNIFSTCDCKQGDLVSGADVKRMPVAIYPSEVLRVSVKPAHWAEGGVVREIALTMELCVHEEGDVERLFPTTPLGKCRGISWDPPSPVCHVYPANGDISPR